MRKSYFLAVAALSTTAYADEGKVAVWDVFPSLVCRADSMVSCTAATDCKSRIPTAIFLVDFKAGTIRATVSNSPSRIIHRDQLDALGYDSVTTDNHGVFAFATTITKTLGSPSLQATMTNPGIPGPYSMWMTCNPF